MSIYNLLVITCWAVFLLVWFTSSFAAKKNAPGHMPWRGILFRIAAIVPIFIFIKYYNGGQVIVLVGPTPVVGALCVVLSAFGIAFAIWARIYLGKNWGMPMSVKEDPELVTTGPYAYVRHPIYTGILVAILGSLLLGGPVFMLIALVPAAYFSWSATQEEKIMEKEFPNEYPGYKQRTKMLIPFVF